MFLLRPWFRYLRGFCLFRGRTMFLPWSLGADSGSALVPVTLGSRFATTRRRRWRHMPVLAAGACNLVRPRSRFRRRARIRHQTRYRCRLQSCPVLVAGLRMTIGHIRRGRLSLSASSSISPTSIGPKPAGISRRGQNRLRLEFKLVISHAAIVAIDSHSRTCPV